MQNRTLQKVFLVLPLYLIGLGFSQSNHLYYHKSPSPVQAGDGVEISQLMFADAPIASGMLFFRDQGELSYQQMDMIFTGGKWVGLIPAHRVTLRGIEYVTILTTQEGGRIALPLVDNPFDTPLVKELTSPLYSCSSSDTSVIISLSFLPKFIDFLSESY